MHTAIYKTSTGDDTHREHITTKHIGEDDGIGDDWGKLKITIR